MVFNSNYPSSDGDGKELAYDLRQGFAMILINILGDIEACMQERDYKGWFEGLDRLFIFISLKLDMKQKEKEESEQDEYNGFLKELNVLIRAKPEVYIKPELEGEEFYSKLKQINIWLLRKMEKYKMFGAKADVEGLV